MRSSKSENQPPISSTTTTNQGKKIRGKGSFALGDDDDDKVDFFLSSWMDYIAANESVYTWRQWQIQLQWRHHELGAVTI